jgi:hypothetical protein
MAPTTVNAGVYTAVVPTPLARVLSVAVVWIIAAVLLFWGRLPGPRRRALALVTSAAGLLFLILAVTSEGLRESPTMSAFLLGTPYVTQSAAASASLPYYVLSGVCLLLGTLGLAVRDEVASRWGQHWLATAIGLTLAVTVLRFVLEKVAAPPLWTYAVGIVWLGPLVGAYFALHVRTEGRGLKELLRALAIYAVAVRAFVAVVAFAVSTLHFGSHYDVTPLTKVRSPFAQQIYQFAPGSWNQVIYVGVLPQLVFWPIFTLLTGLLGAGVVLVLTGLPSTRPAEVSVATQSPAQRPQA